MGIEGQATGGAQAWAWSAGCPASTRHLLVLNVPAYHGSTALQSVLMSARGVTTLCKAGVWQCEADNVLCSNEPTRSLGYTCHSRGQVTVPNGTLVLEILSRYWNLSLPVLLAKMLPNAFIESASPPQAHDGASLLKLTAVPLPRSMTMAGIRRISFRVVQMWWPLCLLQLSKKLWRHYAKTNTTVMDFERQIHEEQAHEHRKLRAAGVPVLLISYADLLWQPDRTLARLRAFLPCRAGERISVDAEPIMGLDIFPNNSWKVRGAIRSFGAQHPASSLGYANGHCINALNYTNSTADTYLRSFS
mmetsp:Transcript_58149/g.133526  ORF Transcript_58149/g.133526 Transcript_58149/m.133526 type:complete len:304 (-) Transcript_58149:262-1173(-)